jgi:cyclic beta-1,2-glucan synthetase
VISEAGNAERVRTAMASVDRLLIRRDERLILLLDPPFAEMTPDPGYIKAYPRGIRENGGQYTHGALWVVMAFARLGEGAHAYELFNLLNPIGHGMAPDRYRVEPYVIAADVYSRPPHVGRGGWTWYTGSAGWMYRVGIEELLGIRVRGATVVIDPCIPPTWPRYEATVRRPHGVLHIAVENPEGVSRGVTHLELDGAALGVGAVPLPDDHRDHHLRVVLGRS